MNSSIPFVYVAGPFSPTRSQTRGLELCDPMLDRARRRCFTEENIVRAAKLGVKVSRLGAYPVVPHAMTADPEYEETQPYEFWIKATKELLSRCDAVLFTDDWQESSGARGENEHAIDLEIPRFFSLSDLAAWLLPAVARLNTVAPSPVLDTERATAPTLPPDSFAPPFDHDNLPKLSDLPADLAAQFPSPFELAAEPPRTVE